MNPLDVRSALHWPAHPAPRPAVLPPPRRTSPPSGPPAALAPALIADPLEQMARDDREDWVLLRLVVCVAVASLILAIASKFVV